MEFEREIKLCPDWETAIGKPGVELLSQLLGEMPAVANGDEEDAAVIASPADLADALRLLRFFNSERLMEEGVVLLNPDTCDIAANVTIGRGTVIDGGCRITGNTVIGENCMLTGSCRLHNVQLGSGVMVERSVMEDCSVADGTRVGPFAFLRPNTHVGQGCRIGDFVELKNSNIGDGTKVSHLTYVGDSDLGKDINLGCGTVFSNYDGKRKFRCSVGDHAFIGCNTNLVAPVNVGDEAYIAAGSTVTEDVPAGSLYVARSRGVAKEGWVSRRKEEGKL